MKENYPFRFDETTGTAYAWFIRMEYRGGQVTSDLEPKLTLSEDKYYDVYQRMGNDAFADLLRKMRSNIRQFFPLDEIKKRETYLWFENDELVGGISIHHNEEENCYEIEKVVVALGYQGKGYGKKLLNFAVAKLQQTHRTPIFLTVAACNEKAVKMYEKFGFVPVSEIMDEWKVEEKIG
ncbi:MAG TPA: GNAT family N-acetyltransferase [Acetivibrio sp.]|uniref:GNAT family N-acetyltransferase n=1 Tax=Acetivibrio sp. TaxID=1872092 RepID=UPI002D103945|nr:GNAT family N-acetyltransferase [Acetivibrio sp.]HOM01684.1 GNAT family N-acetyltransferase [Acetivibrio sp.]